MAENGKEALAVLEKQSFDLVFMDVQMPVMDGLQATAAIREREKKTGRHLPVIAMTAHAMVGDRELCIAAGMDNYNQANHAGRTVEHFEAVFRAIGSLGPQSRKSPTEKKA